MRREPVDKGQPRFKTPPGHIDNDWKTNTMDFVMLRQDESLADVLFIQ